MPNLRDLFLLDPEVTFLNHGSFGATPRRIFEAYQKWQLQLEHQPVQFIARDLPGLLWQVRQDLGGYINAHPDDLVLIPNATFGVNLVARSLQLEPGDEILTSDHEYGACMNTWEFICQHTGARIVQQSVLLPAGTEAEIIDQLWQGVTPRTRLIFLSHLSSPTALKLPVEPVCSRARQEGILTIIDGAHAPGQIPLDLEATGADFYTGNCHKWMMAPKGSAFLWARRDRQAIVDPLVVSWGWKENPAFSTGSRFVDQQQWWGTKDPAAYLAVSDAIHFMEEYHWDEIRQCCQNLLRVAEKRICCVTGLDSIYPAELNLQQQMASVLLPPIEDPKGFQERLYGEHRVEIPCIQWNGQQLVRISIQGYNTEEDVEKLAQALAALLNEPG